ncbi:organic solute transporter alpha-like protein [Uranotaenia lowii]|uniref:organic solute transporter alpha-like protein n=1 Tax=Uranotaenia lowii TaxID=190385 RepID=UPI0024786A93|nr:organic solute transporter alpha-like protein [Uranotaenia lowii]XP_055603155.1 organic solute transporter alpha-like protein [Uranotaenia lowii]XP_055603156.1 organic solute transporter alpha-like protein [Uranotaenia lowii]XP_055603157.1 organic solute transporter alpha-like protein [Uranotaenia lowii]XP_055603159.1 organic solute transporter alpha-like protein [Uranotaenia lowii]
MRKSTFFVFILLKMARLLNGTTDDEDFSQPEMGNNDTETSPCPSQLPTVIEYLNGIDLILTVIIAITIILSVGTVVVCIRNVRLVLGHTPKRYKTKSILVLVIYPIVTMLAIVSILIPKSYFVCDTVSHIYFMISAYVFYSLIMDYIGGEDAFIKSSDTETFTARTPPCCCCLPFLKRSTVTKNRLLFVRLLILQLPIVQSSLFIGLNVVYVEDVLNFNRILTFFVPFIVVSIILGVWGLNIIVRMVGPLHVELKLMGKYAVLQLVLILCKIQPLIIMGLVTYITPRCDFPLTLQVQKNAVFQMCLCAEMLLLSLWASHLYKTPSKTRQLLAKTEPSGTF